MPPSGFSKQAVEGILQFVKANYEDLKQEVVDGKHKDFETAIDHEVASLRKALEKLHIDKDGNLVEQ